MNGQRCFIVGTGNSISDIDIDKLKNENIIFLNSFLHHDQYIDIAASKKGKKFHLFTPLHKFKNKKIHDDYMDEFKTSSLKNVTCFFGIDDFSTNYIEEFKKKEMSILDNSFFIYCNKKYKDVDALSEEDFEISKNIWSPKTSSNLALFLAIYMGFKDIYLIGVDHDQINTINADNLKVIKNGSLVIEERKEWKKLFEKGRVDQTLFLKDLVEIIKPMELIEKRYPGRVKNLSRRSIFYCHDEVDINNIEMK